MHSPPFYWKEGKGRLRPAGGPIPLCEGLLFSRFSLLTGGVQHCGTRASSNWCSGGTGRAVRGTTFSSRCLGNISLESFHACLTALHSTANILSIEPSILLILIQPFGASYSILVTALFCRCYYARRTDPVSLGTPSTWLPPFRAHAVLPCSCASSVDWTIFCSASGAHENAAFALCRTCRGGHIPPPGVEPDSLRFPTRLPASSVRACWVHVVNLLWLAENAKRPTFYPSIRWFLRDAGCTFTVLLPAPYYSRAARRA